MDVAQRGLDAGNSLYPWLNSDERFESAKLFDYPGTRAGFTPHDQPTPVPLNVRTLARGFGLARRAVAGTERSRVKHRPRLSGPTQGCDDRQSVSFSAEMRLPLKPVHQLPSGLVEGGRAHSKAGTPHGHASSERLSLQIERHGLANED